MLTITIAKQGVTNLCINVVSMNQICRSEMEVVML